MLKNKLHLCHPTQYALKNLRIYIYIYIYTYTLKKYVLILNPGVLQRDKGNAKALEVKVKTQHNKNITYIIIFVYKRRNYCS